MNITYRRAVKTDFDSINALFMEMLRAIYHKDDVNGYEPGSLDYYFSGGESWICLAETEDAVVGFLAIEVHREEFDYLYYDDFSVSASLRSRGIGAELMQKAEDYARSLGIEKICLHVEKENQRAFRFYEKHGFAPVRDDGTRLLLGKELQDRPC